MTDLTKAATPDLSVLLKSRIEGYHFVAWREPEGDGQVRVAASLKKSMFSIRGRDPVTGEEVVIPGRFQSEVRLSAPMPASAPEGALLDAAQSIFNSMKHQHDVDRAARIAMPEADTAAQLSLSM